MAEKKESIEISYKANMSDLTKKLAQMPNVTAKEAKKMVGALDRQLKQAESAAKRSAAASKKAMKASSAAAKKGAKDFKKLATSASMVGASFIAMGVGAIAFTQKIADLTNELSDASTKTGIAVETLAGLRLAAKGSGLEFSNLEGGLIRFQKSMVDSETGTKKLEDAFGALKVKVKDSEKNFRSTNDTFNDVMKSLSQMEAGAERNAIAMEIFGKKAGPGLIQSGALDNLESMTELATAFGVAVDEKAIGSMARFQRSMATFEVATQGSFAKIMESISGKNSISLGIDAASSSMVYFSSLASDAFARAGQDAENLFGVLKMGAIMISGTGTVAERFEKSKELAKELALETKIVRSNYDNMFSRANAEVEKFNNLAAKTKNIQKGTAVILGEQLETEKQKAKKGKLSAAAAKAKAKAEKEALKALKLAQKIMEGNQTLTEKIEDSLVSNLDRQASANEREINQISEKEARAQLQIERNLASEIKAINELEALTGKTFPAEIAREQAIEDASDAAFLASLEKQNALSDLKEELHDQELERIDAIDQKETAAAKKRIDEQFAIAGAALGFSSAIIDNIEENSKAQADAAQKMFRLRQAESLAGIAMATAEGIVTANMKYPGPVGMGLSAFLVSTAAIQAATVMAQTPPSMHMGGLANDETSARVLKGEAVLDRSTVRRIGGEQGVKNLQQGGNSESGSVVIIQPFKHFGRFAKEIGYRKPRRTGIGSY